MYLEGPYGRDLLLDRYETVILIAQGLGIAGVLSYALDIVHRRRYHQKEMESVSSSHRAPTDPYYHSITRKIDIVWDMQHPEQLAWCSEQLKDLARLDREGSKGVRLATPFPTRLLIRFQLVIAHLFYPKQLSPDADLPSSFSERWGVYACPPYNSDAFLGSVVGQNSPGGTAVVGSLSFLNTALR